MRRLIGSRSKEDQARLVQRPYHFIRCQIIPIAEEVSMKPWKKGCFIYGQRLARVKMSARTLFRRPARMKNVGPLFGW